MTTTTTQPLLQLRGIHKTYGAVQALTNVNFRVGHGEIVALLGDNGAGKSTLVRTMSGVTIPDQGEFIWNGEPAKIRDRTDTERLGIETIFQDSALVDSMSVSRNIFMGREIRNQLGFMRLRQMDAISAEILRSVVTIEGIGSPDVLVGGLSGGQKQAVAIARAVHFKRSLLILDEPTSALAVRATEALLQYLRHLKDEGISSVLVTHNMYHAYQVCDRFVVMGHGQVVLDVPRHETSVDELTSAVVGAAAA
jgi:simple sugar transport system ATP-binding protein